MHKHKHYDVIVAWAEGKPVQFRMGTGGDWINWRERFSPAWNALHDYRVKPATIRYRVALLKDAAANEDGVYPYACIHEEGEVDYCESWSSFVRWVGDWQEVEV